MAADHGVGDGVETFAAPAFNFDLLFEPEEFFDHFAVQFQRFGVVGPQNVGDGTGGT